MQIAVIADVHLHDLYGGYGMLEEASGEVALRTLSDTMASTRVFNESYPAFLAALDDIVQRSIRHVVLLGDYSDDGQIDAVMALKRILSFYEKTHGLRFFVTFGNHDCFGPAPRHQEKWLTMGDGRNPVLVTSDTHARAPAAVQSGMLGMSTAGAMDVMAAYGVQRPQGVVHWEAPFSGGATGPDASYLVEPQSGLWLLMLDANVFHEIDGIWQVRADAAWDHVLAERPYILEWISDVAQRATRLGKTLLAFSHYPALPLTLTGSGETLRSTGTRDWLARMPQLETGRLLAKAGLRWHFSGHMHVSRHTRLDDLVNIAVPSPVAYPGGYVVVAIDNGVVTPQTVSLDEITGFDRAFSAYETQIADDDQFNGTSVLACSTYPEFLRSHLLYLVATRHSPSDWQSDLLDHLDRPMAQLFQGHAGFLPIMEKWPGVASQPFRLMMEDYYVIRTDQEAARKHIPRDRCEFYRALGHALGTCRQGETQSVSHLFLELFFTGFSQDAGSYVR